MHTTIKPLLLILAFFSVSQIHASQNPEDNLEQITPLEQFINNQPTPKQENLTTALIPLTIQFKEIEKSNNKTLRIKDQNRILHELTILKDSKDPIASLTFLDTTNVENPIEIAIEILNIITTASWHNEIYIIELIKKAVNYLVEGALTEKPMPPKITKAIISSIKTKYKKHSTPSLKPEVETLLSALNFFKARTSLANIDTKAPIAELLEQKKPKLLSKIISSTKTQHQSFIQCIYIKTLTELAKFDRDAFILLMNITNLQYYYLKKSHYKNQNNWFNLHLTLQGLTEVADQTNHEFFRNQALLAKEILNDERHPIFISKNKPLLGISDFTSLEIYTKNDALEAIRILAIKSLFILSLHWDHSFREIANIQYKQRINDLKLLTNSSKFNLDYIKNLERDLKIIKKGDLTYYSHKLYQIFTDKHSLKKNKFYISLRGKSSQEKEIKSLTKHVESFLETENSLYLLSGDHGSGKTTFCKHLTKFLWNKYKGKIVPIFLTLDNKTSNETFDSTLAKTYSLDETEIAYLKKYAHQEQIKLFFIIDYNKNHLNEKEVAHLQQEWKNTQFLITFNTTNINTTKNNFSTKILPFNKNQIKDFLEKTNVKLTHEQQQEILNNPNLKNLKFPLFCKPLLNTLYKHKTTLNFTNLGKSDIPANYLARLFFSTLLKLQEDREYPNYSIPAIYTLSGIDLAIYLEEISRKNNTDGKNFWNNDLKKTYAEYMEILPLKAGIEPPEFIHKSLKNYLIALGFFLDKTPENFKFNQESTEVINDYRQHPEKLFTHLKSLQLDYETETAKLKLSKLR